MVSHGTLAEGVMVGVIDGVIVILGVGVRLSGGVSPALQPSTKPGGGMNVFVYTASEIIRVD